MENLFATKYKECVPAVYVKVGNVRKHICELTHRITDGVWDFVKDSPRDEVLEALRTGDPVPLLKINPTAFLFGFWDSHKTGVRRPRHLHAVITAGCVSPLAELSNSQPSFTLEELGAEGKISKSEAAKLGYLPIPSRKETLVLVRGDIYRVAVLHPFRDVDVVWSAYLNSLGRLVMTDPDAYTGMLRVGCTLQIVEEEGISMSEERRRELYAETVELRQRLCGDEELVYEADYSNYVSQ